jgi:hypothetical protein
MGVKLCHFIGGPGGKGKPGRRRLSAIKDVIDWAARETQAFGAKSP